MVKKLKIFQAVEELFSKSVDIYQGPIHKISADDFSMHRNSLRVKRKDQVIKNGALYYRDGFNFVNIDYECILPTQEEALGYCNSVIDKKRNTIISTLNNSNLSPKESSRILAEIKSETECIYGDENELKYSHTMAGKEFKKLMQTKSVMKTKNKDKKN